MKKVFSFMLLVMGLVGSAQHNLPQSETDVAPLFIGEKVPELSLQSMEGETVALRKILGQKRTVLVFYRGGWCPYCNLHLAALGEAEKELLDLGYQIVAISPDAPSNLKVTEEKNKLNYLLLSDSAGTLAKAMGIAFQAPEKYKTILTKGSEGVNSNFLAVPSVFIVNLNSEIEFEHITPDYKHRISNALLIAAAKALQQ